MCREGIVSESKVIHRWFTASITKDISKDTARERPCIALVNLLVDCV